MLDWLQLAKVAKKHNILYEFKALPGEDLNPVIQSFFQDIFKREKPEIQWQQLPLALIPKEADSFFYEKKLQPFGLVPKKDQNWFSKASFIEIEIALLETKSSSSLALGGKGEHQELSFSSLLSLLNFLKAKGEGGNPSSFLFAGTKQSGVTYPFRWTYPHYSL